MKMYVTARFKGVENKDEIEALCRAVKDAGLDDFCFVRDAEKYQKIFDNPKELWSRSLEEIKKCDGLLIDASDNPSGGRVVEVGIAYALGMPIFVAIKNDHEYKEIFDGVSRTVIKYNDFGDVTAALKLLCH